MWRNSRLATRRCQGTSAVAILWPRGLAVHIAPSVEASSTRSRSVAGSKASRHEEEKKWVKTQRFSYLKSLKWKDSEDLHQRITLCFFLLIGERHASTAHREGNAGKPELTCKDFYLQKGQGQKTSQWFIHQHMLHKSISYHDSINATFILWFLIHFHSEANIIYMKMMVSQDLRLFEVWIPAAVLALRPATSVMESIPRNGARIFRKIVKNTKMRGFGQPSFLMQIFFQIFRTEHFFVFKKGREWE